MKTKSRAADCRFIPPTSEEKKHCQYFRFFNSHCYRYSSVSSYTALRFNTQQPSSRGSRRVCQNLRDENIWTDGLHLSLICFSALLPPLSLHAVFIFPPRWLRMITNLCSALCTRKCGLLTSASALTFPWALVLSKNKYNYNRRVTYATAVL